MCSNRMGCAARSRFCEPFPRSLPPNPAGTFRCTGLSSDLCRDRDEEVFPVTLTEDSKHRFGVLHYAYLTVLNVRHLCPFALWSGSPGLQIGRTLLLVGWAAQRGPVFRMDAGLFCAASPRTRRARFPGTGLSSDLCRVRDRVGVDPVMARRADDERLAPHLGHEDGPRGLARSRFPELFEAGDLVNCHRGTGLAQLAFPVTEPHEQLLAGDATRAGGGVGDAPPPVLPQDDPAESCYQVRLALPLPPGLEAGPG